MVDHFYATYGFLKHFDTKIIYIIIIIITILKVFNWKEKENARLPNTYGTRLYYPIVYIYHIMNLNNYESVTL